jgi:hypothetical protein
MISCYRIKNYEQYIAQQNKEVHNSGVGNLHVSKRMLRALVGNPDDDFKSGDGKVTELYTLKIGGVIVSIYDWKSGYKRLPMDFTNWSVGGVEGSVYLLAEWLKEQKADVEIVDGTFPTIKVWGYSI